MAAELVAREADRAGLTAWLDAHGSLIEAAAARPGAEALRGRGRVFVAPAPGAGTGARWVVRHYHRGGALAGLLDDRYVRVGDPRPFREFRLIRALEALGVPTAPAVGAAAYPAGPCYRGDLVTEWVPDSEDLARVLFGADQLDEGARGPAGSREPPAAEAAMEATGALVRLLHERGVSHPDLNVKNILLAPGPAGPQALVLDLDRARLRDRIGRRGRRRMLSRFERSLRKWEERTGRPLPGTVRAAFRRGYGTLPGPASRAGAGAARPR